MADVCDDADESMAIMLKYQLEVARNKKQEGVLTAVGVCHNCNDSVPPGIRFCDKACSDDWEYRRNLEVKRRI